jgi:hypothetical protein
LTEIHCPPDCAYLAVAREHPAAVVRRQQELDLRAFLPAVHDLTEEQNRLLWLVLSSVRDFRPDGFLRLTDDEVAEAAASLASTLETAARGVIYEHRPGSVAAQQLTDAIKETVGRLPEARGSSFERELAVVLRRVEQGARDARKHFGGDVTAYLGVIARLTRSSNEAAEPTEPAPEKQSGLILP